MLMKILLLNFYFLFFLLSGLSAQQQYKGIIQDDIPIEAKLIRQNQQGYQLQIAIAGSRDFLSYRGDLKTLKNGKKSLYLENTSNGRTVIIHLQDVSLDFRKSENSIWLGSMWVKRPKYEYLGNTALFIED